MTHSPGHRGGPLPGWQVPGEAFRTAVESGRLDLPLPGSGRTRERWAAFAELAEEDLSLARLGEGHADALAILAELEGPAPPPGSRWGVWAAHPPGPTLEAWHSGHGWRLRGTKRYCSGARWCTHALVTADAPDGRRLFAAEVRTATPVPGTWPATGMAASETLDVGFPAVPAEPVGAPGAGPLCLDEAHSRRVADLTVYVRQHAAERNLAELGALVAERGPQW